MEEKYYMTQSGETLVFWRFDDKKMAYEKVGEAKLGKHAGPIYEATRRKRLKFHV